MSCFYVRPRAHFYVVRATLIATLLTSSLSLSSCQSLRQDSKLEEVALEWDSANLDVGKGVDSISEVIRGRCVEFADSDFREPIGGNQVSTGWNIELVTDRYTFEKRLSISASAKLRAGIAGQGSIKGKFLEIQTANDYNVYAIVSINRDSGKKILRNATLAPAAIAMLQNGRQDEFRRRCGDEYFTAVRYGGEFFAVMEFKTSSDELKREIELQIKAQARGGAWDASGSVSFREALTEISKHSEIRVSGYQIGPRLSSVSDQMTVDGLFAAADAFVAEISATNLTNAAPYFTVSEPYTNLLSYPAEANPEDYRNQKEIILDMDYKRLELRRSLDNIDFVLQYADQFEAYDIDSVKAMRNKIVTALNILHASASTCFDSIKDCQQPLYETVAVQLPKRKAPTVTGRDPSCGVERYNVAEGPACGDPTFPLGRTESCGVESYKQDRTAACGVELYYAKRTEHCGTETYNTRADASCPGSIKEDEYTVVSTGRNASEPEACRTGYLQIDYRTTSGTWMGGGRDHDMVEGIVKRERDCKRQAHFATCTKPEFGTKTYKLCRHSKHNIEKYKLCDDPSHGVNLYKRCSSPANGPATFPRCEDESFGVALFKECAHVGH